MTYRIAVNDEQRHVIRTALDFLENVVYGELAVVSEHWSKYTDRPDAKRALDLALSAASAIGWPEESDTGAWVDAAVAPMERIDATLALDGDLTLAGPDLAVLLDALDLYERVIGLGQLEVIEERWRWHADAKSSDFGVVSDALRHALDAAKAIGWRFAPGQSRGIYCRDVPRPALIAYDLTQAIRKFRSDVRLAKAIEEGDTRTIQSIRYTVDQRPYRGVCPDVPRAKVELVEVPAADDG